MAGTLAAGLAATGGRPPRAQGGFTLIEIMMVVVIIGILVAVVVPQMLGQDDEARLQAERATLARLGAALELYKLDNRRYPTTEQGLQALVQKPAGLSDSNTWGPTPYWRKLPLDQWDNEYVYQSRGQSFELKSLGADGAEGGEGVDSDIRYADL